MLLYLKNLAKKIWMLKIELLWNNLWLVKVRFQIRKKLVLDSFFNCRKLGLACQGKSSARLAKKEARGQH